jgi:hypothetical protein
MTSRGLLGLILTAGVATVAHVSVYPPVLSEASVTR